MALFDAYHVNHEEAHGWFASNGDGGWATCALTVNGCVRVLSNPAYPSSVTATKAVTYLRTLSLRGRHVFWRETVSLLDEKMFAAEFLLGHQKVADAYLLGMAVRHGGRLVTFDRAIPLRAVRGTAARHVELLGGAS